MNSATAMPEAARWELRIDGNARLVSTDGALVVLERRDAALMIYLAIEGPTAREKLLALLWPDEAGPTLRGRLRQRVFALKRKLGIEAVEGSAALTLAPGIRWAGLAAGADDKPPLAQDEFRDLPEFAEWLTALRERRQALQCDRLAEQASEFERQGRLASAIALAERLVALSPLQEHAHRRCMRLHYLRGDRAAALAAFDDCERVLKDEISTRPSAETLALLAQIEAAAVLDAAAAPPEVPVTVMRPPILVGREAEWRRLEAAWASMQAAVVIGEAGLGKSRLLTDLATAHGLAQGRVVMVSARPGDERVTYAVLCRLLRALLDRGRRQAPAAWVAAELARLLPELGAASAASADAQSTRLLGAVEHLVIQARDDGLDALILDDLHFCDRASLEVAQQLLGTTTGVRWLVALRGAELGTEVHDYVDELVGQARADKLVLQPLDVTQIGELLDSLRIPGIHGPALAAPLHQRTGGNILYLLETLKAMLQHEVPPGAEAMAQTLARLPTAPSVGRLIEQRLNHLSAGALRLVRCAAIAGGDFSAPLAAQVLGVRPLDLSDAWSELEAAQVLREGTFAHDLIFEAVLASVPPVIAVAFHGDVAAWLESRAADPGRVAHHWQQAQQWPQAGQAWMAAAAHCARQGRRTEQARCLALAADCHGRTPDAGRRVQALLDRAATLAQYEVGDQARAALEELEREVHTDAQRLTLLSLRSVLANLVGEFDRTLALAPAALELARSLGNEDEVFAITNQWCGALTKSFRAPEALVLMQSLRSWVDERANPAQRYEYWNGLALALDFAHRLGDSLLAWQKSCDVAEAMDYDLLPQAVNNLGYTYAKMGQHERAVVLARRALTLCQGRGEAFDATGLGPIIRFALGHHLRNIGCYAEAIELMEEAARGFEAGRAAMLLASVQHQLALLWVQLGQPARALALVADELPQQTAVQQAQRCAFRAAVLAALGRPAVDEIRRALALVPNADGLAHRMWTLVATEIVPPDEGEALADSLAIWAAERERLGLALAAHGRAARCALATSDREAAQTHVEAALRLARDVQPDLYYLPELWWVAAQVYAAAALHDCRRSVLQTGADWVLRIAREQVPEAFRDSFLRRNPINADLLHWHATAATPAGAGSRAD